MNRNIDFWDLLTALFLTAHVAQIGVFEHRSFLVVFAPYATKFVVKMLDALFTTFVEWAQRKSQEGGH